MGQFSIDLRQSRFLRIISRIGLFASIQLMVSCSRNMGDSHNFVKGHIYDQNAIGLENLENGIKYVCIYSTARGDVEFAVFSAEREPITSLVGSLKFDTPAEVARDYLGSVEKYWGGPLLTRDLPSAGFYCIKDIEQMNSKLEIIEKSDKSIQYIFYTSIAP